MGRATSTLLKELDKLNEKISEEMEALESSSPKYVIEKLTVPFLTENTKEGEERERNLVVIEK